MSVLSVDQSAVTIRFIERASPEIELSITSLDLFPPYMRGLAFFLFTHGENRNRIKIYLAYKLKKNIGRLFPRNGKNIKFTNKNGTNRRSHNTPSL